MNKRGFDIHIHVYDHTGTGSVFLLTKSGDTETRSGHVVFFLYCCCCRDVFPTVTRNTLAPLPSLRGLCIPSWRPNVHHHKDGKRTFFDMSEDSTVWRDDMFVSFRLLFFSDASVGRSLLIVWSVLGALQMTTEAYLTPKVSSEHFRNDGEL